MKPSFGPTLAVLLAWLAVAACTKEPPAAPPSVLPSLERPVLTLNVRPDALEKLMIPLLALVERGGIPGVFVLQNDQARFRMVRPGKTNAARVQILSGLHGAETLVLGNLTNVHDGSPIIKKNE